VTLSAAASVGMRSRDEVFSERAALDGLTRADPAVDFDAMARAHLVSIEEALRSASGGDGVLFEAARYHLGTGGKRIRAILPALIAKNLGATGEALDEALALGVALELIHNGTLVHDDLQDGDVARRGQPTVWARFGMQQAVNVGTAMLLLGLAKVLSTRAAQGIIADVNIAILHIVEGQALEFELQASDDPTVARWERMAAGKTGALFGACFIGGVAAVGGSDRARDAAWAFGVELGVFFQLQDDLLDLIGDKGRDAIATDLAEGKISWPVAWCCEHGAATEAMRLIAIVKTPREATTPEMVAEALAILHRTGAIAAAIEALRRSARALVAAPWCEVVPGVVERVMAPVRHVLDG
jgi:geranylgeranyl diphosphate synthase type I